jgi:hypothetical protein
LSFVSFFSPYFVYSTCSIDQICMQSGRFCDIEPSSWPFPAKFTPTQALHESPFNFSFNSNSNLFSPIDRPLQVFQGLERSGLHLHAINHLDILSHTQTWLVQLEYILGMKLLFLSPKSGPTHKCLFR